MKVHSGFYSKNHNCKNFIKKNLFKIKTDEEIISKLFKENSRILDYGCGKGKLIEFLNNKFNNLEVIGYDIDDLCINYCKKKNYNVFNSLNKIKEKFDFIVCNEVVAYMDEKEILKFFDFSSKNLKEGGKIIICMQNANEFYTFMETWDRPGHVRLYSKDALKRLGEQFNFKISKIIKHHLRINPLKLLVNLVLGFDIYSGICVILSKK